MGHASYFVRDTRTSSFVRLKDDAPEWMTDAIFEAHSGRLPDDWIFEICQSAFEAADNGATSDEPEIDSCLDAYTADLYEWAQAHCHDDAFCEAEEDSPGGRIEDQLRAIQAHYCARIFTVILEACEEHENEEEEP